MSGRLIVNDESAAMAIESVVTYFRTRLCVNDRTKETIEVVKMPDTLYRFDLGASRCEMLRLDSCIARLCSFRSTVGNRLVLK